MIFHVIFCYSVVHLLAHVVNNSTILIFQPMLHAALDNRDLSSLFQEESDCHCLIDIAVHSAELISPVKLK